MEKGFGASDLTNTVFYATVNGEKHIFDVEKKDVTDDCIRAVFEWFAGNMEGKEEFSLTYPSSDFELVMKVKENENV